MGSRPVRVITTGGTFDKIYSIDSELVTGEPAALGMLHVAGVHDVPVAPLMAKDSLEMDAQDRLAIADAVAAASEQAVIIVHGTDTMIDTARVLQADQRLNDKVVVLTGAMQPASMRDSDAAFNLGAALAAVRLQPAGVWIAMSGLVLAADNARKDREEQRFVSLTEDA